MAANGTKYKKRTFFFFLLFSAFICLSIPCNAYSQVIKGISRVSIINKKGKGLPGKSFDPAVNFEGGVVTFVFGFLLPKVGRFEIPALRAPSINRTFILNTAQDGGVPNDAYPLSDSTFDSQTKSSISADGQFIAFANLSSNLVSNDTNGFNDIFLLDALNINTTRVSVSADGIEANENSSMPRISADGNFVAFSSFANNLLPGDSDENLDIFVKNLQSGEVEKIDSPLTHGFDPAISGAGRFVTFSATDTLDADIRYGILFDRETKLYSSISNLRSTISQEISWDGRYIVFQSTDNIIPGLELSPDNSSQVYLFDALSGDISLVSKGISGLPGNSHSGRPSIDASGRLVAYVSFASDIVEGDQNNKADIFVREISTDKVVRVSLTSSCVESKAAGAFKGFRTGQPVISGDGKKVVFTTKDRLVTSPLKVMGFSQEADKNNFEDVYMVDIDFDASVPVFDPEFAPQGARVALNCIGKQPTIFFPETLDSAPDVARSATTGTSSLLKRVIVSSNSAGQRQEVRRLITKRNELTIKDLPPGNYEAKFRFESQRAGSTVRGKFSSPLKFEIVG